MYHDITVSSPANKTSDKNSSQSFLGNSNASWELIYSSPPNGDWIPSAITIIIDKL